MTTLPTTSKFSSLLFRYHLASLILWSCLFNLLASVQAQSFGSPDECSTYTGAAQTKCLYAYIEAQRKRLSQIEDALHGQTNLTDHTPQPIDQLSTRNRDSQPPVPANTPPEYIYPPMAPGYANAGYGYTGVPYEYPGYGSAFGLPIYPGVRLSLGFGNPGFYGRPFLSPRYIYRSPGFFRPSFSNGSRVYAGPRFYPSPRYYSGPRSFGHRSFRHHR